MAARTSTISLRGSHNGEDSTKSYFRTHRPAILLNLNDQIVNDLRQCHQNNKLVQFLGGLSPKIRYGSKTLDLNVKPETFRYEIYSAKDQSSGQLDFASLVSHAAHVKSAEKKTGKEDGGDDAALAALKQSLASMAKEKEARKATISNSVIANTKNGRSSSSRSSNPLLQRPTSASSHSSTPHHSAAPTSVPPTEKNNIERAMRLAIIHLLATGFTGSTRDIGRKLGVPGHETIILAQYVRSACDNTGGLGPQQERWQLNNRAWKEIEPWKFKYATQQDRQKAIDNAIRAFDRMRLPRDDALWQVLLPREERGKGKVLSRLNLGLSPMHNAGDKSDNVSTPKVGPASTPRSGALATSRVNAGMSIEKRVKEAKKKQELEKKKKEKEAAAASDRESKPKDLSKARSNMAPANPTTKKMPVKKVAEKFKSAEVVLDSDDDDSSEVARTKVVKKSDTSLGDSRRTTADSKATLSKRTSDDNKADPKARPSSSQAMKVPPKDISTGRPAKRENPVVSSTSTSNGRTTATAQSKITASDRPIKSSQAVSSSERASSPKNVNKPKVPSPLGTVKPRIASEEPEKPRKVVPAKSAGPPTPSSKRATPVNSAQKAARPGLFGDNGRPSPVIKKRPLEQIDSGSEPPHKAVKVNAGSTVKASSVETVKSSASTGKTITKPSQSGDIKRRADSGTSSSDSKLKRKADDAIHDDERLAPKHRKTDSSSTHSLDNHTNSSLTSLTTAATTSPDPASPRSPLSLQRIATTPTASTTDVIQMFLNDSAASPKTRSTWEAALDKAARFRTQLYPAYIELYDRLEGMAPGDVEEEDRRTLFMMHGKLKALKKEIHDAVG